MNEWQAEQLEKETYVNLTWEDWAYLVDTCGHYPKVVACGEEGFTVIRDGLTNPHKRFYYTSVYTSQPMWYDSKQDSWYLAHLKATLV